MRLWDIGRIGRRYDAKEITPDITSLSWPLLPDRASTREFATLLLPYRGPRPEARLISDADSFTLQRRGNPNIIFRHDGQVVF